LIQETEIAKKNRFVRWRRGHSEKSNKGLEGRKRNFQTSEDSAYGDSEGEKVGKVGEGQGASGQNLIEQARKDGWLSNGPRNWQSRCRNAFRAGEPSRRRVQPAQLQKKRRKKGIGGGQKKSENERSQKLGQKTVPLAPGPLSPSSFDPQRSGQKKRT